MIEAGEACDGAQLGGKTCVDSGYSKPDGLTCVNCMLDTSGCKSTCGNGATEPGEGCDDGNLANGDGCDATCHVEPLAGTTCGSAIMVTLGSGSKDLTGMTDGGGVHSAAGCASGALDRIYAVKVTAAGFLTANIVRSQTAYDTVLYIASNCSDNNPMQDILCNDSVDPQNLTQLKGGEVVSIRVQANQTYYIVVDGKVSGEGGAYKLHLDLSGGVECGDPVPIPLELGTGMTVLGSNTGISAFPVVQGSCGGQPSGQVVYAVTRAASGKVDVDTVNASTNYNSVLYARTACSTQNTEIDCSNNQGTAAESISIPNAAAGTPVFVWVDGSQQGGGAQTGNYGITFTP